MGLLASWVLLTYSRALAYAKAGAQSRRTANLLNGFVQRGEITAAQAEQIMKELY